MPPFEDRLGGIEMVFVLLVEDFLEELDEMGCSG